MPEAKYTCEQDALCGVNVPKDARSLVDLEKKHLPVIIAPDRVNQNDTFEIDVAVGGIDGVQHPNEPGHSIEWIELYCGDTFLGRAQYSGGTSYPVARFKVKLAHAHGPLKAWAKCNLHGLWEGVKGISI
ncbi:MAG: desulfoferrodoxin family protein [Candidatus Omnitrophota bacterium]